MNMLLLFFALPIATIILASALETILCSPIRVASVFFAIFLVVTFSIFDETFLIFALVYTILAYISAVITRFFIRLCHCKRNHNNENNSIDVTSATINTVNATINAENLEERSGNNNSNNNCSNSFRYRRF